MSASPTICLTCRLSLIARLCKTQTLPKRPRRPDLSAKQWRPFSTTRAARQHYDTSADNAADSDARAQTDRWTKHSLQQTRPTPANGQAEHQTVEELEQDIPDREPSDIPEEALFDAVKQREDLEIPEAKPSPEFVAQAARQAFGEYLPEGALNDEQYKLYERMYGKPLEKSNELEEDEDTRDVLYKEGKDGMLEEIGVLEPDLVTESEQATQNAAGEEEPGQEEPEEVDEAYEQSAADAQLQRDIAAALAKDDLADTSLTIRSPDEVILYGEEEASQEDEDKISAEDGGDLRAHPFTSASRAGTVPSSVPLPRSSFTGPVSLLLGNISNKHLDEAAHNILGGPGLPYSPSTPYVSRTMPQKPVALNAAQAKMSDMEADIYMTAVMPQTYASVLSTIVETRKRLGAGWLENLLRREEGPRILDAGAGGAGVIAWREVLKAEWKRMNDIAEPDANVTESGSDSKPERHIPSTPVGKAMVLTGSDSLRQRASVLLENTTFLPRLPDYVHAQFASEDTHRKQFDIIVAPHSLWHLHENYERRQKVLNLWSLLDPNGGVLILLEKGVPRGFEVIADARAYIVGELFERSEGAKDDLDDVDLDEPEDINEGMPNKRVSRRAPAQIVAPCPHSQKCPLYLIPGASRQRKDWCHFKQRYVRPPYLQRLLGAKDRNFDDVEFSYVAVQKGVENSAPIQGRAASERAFGGYEMDDEDVVQPPQKVPHPFGVQYVQSPPRILNPLPRILLPPLKRQGHIHLDMCTPAGSFSRWTVPRSYGKQAYRDARKASWGDLWALGAKQRENRRVRLGVKGMEAGIGTGRGAESKGGKPAMKTKDVKGKGVDTGAGDVTRRDERLERRRAAKVRGREKARSRRRSETKEFMRSMDV